MSLSAQTIAHDAMRSASGLRTAVQYSFVQQGPLRWRVAAMGPTDAPSALLLHGAGASSHSMVPLMRLLSEDFRVVAPDLPGHARTTGTGFHPTLPNVAGVLARLLGALELSPELVIGHSAGAAAAMRLALDQAPSQRPRLLVGLAPAVYPFRPHGNALAQLAAAALGRSMWPSVLAGYLSKPRRVRRLLRSTGSILDARGIRAYQNLLSDPAHIRGVLAMMSRWDVAGLAAEIAATELPLLLLTGSADRAVDSNRIAELADSLPRCTHVEIEGAGHLLHEEQPHRIGRIVTERLRPRDDHKTTPRHQDEEDKR